MSNHYGFTGLAQMYHRAIIKNELAYWGQGDSLLHAGTKNSGYSFGPIQWDVANNPDAPEILRDILKNSVYDTGPNVEMEKWWKNGVRSCNETFHEIFRCYPVHGSLMC